MFYFVRHGETDYAVCSHYGKRRCHNVLTSDIKDDRPFQLPSFL